MTTVFVNQRQNETPTSTQSILLVDGAAAPWGANVFGLEPGAKTPSHPRVAAGDYPLELRPFGGKYEKFMSVAKLREVIRPGLFHLVMSPDRLALIHPGNTVRDTEACWLPGLSRSLVNGEWQVGSSQDALLKIYPHILRAIQNGGAVWRVVDV